MGSLIDRTLNAYDLLRAQASISTTKNVSLLPRMVAGKVFIGGLPYHGFLSAQGSIGGKFISGSVLSGAFVAQASITADWTTEQLQNNWVAWSAIGSASFTLTRTNDAGRMPTGLPGWVYKVMTLQVGKPGVGAKLCAVVYGSDGVSLLIPENSPAPTFGIKTLSPVGVLSPNLITGDDNDQYYVDNKGNLCTVNSETVGTPAGIKSLGYSTILRNIDLLWTVPVMLYEQKSKRVRICNGVEGYVYTAAGLGKGLAGLTGLLQSESSLFGISPSTLVYDNASVTTNITDCGTRDYKPLHKVVVSTYAPEMMSFCVDYRSDIHQEFKTTVWKQFTPTGEGFVNCTGVEFRVRLRSESPTDAQIDDLVLHIKQTDSVLRREAIK